MTQEIIWRSTDAVIARDGSTGAETIIGPPEAVKREAARGIVRGAIDVTAYGATGDGVTDDTAAIQRALDDAPALGVSTVRIPSGTYMIGAVPQGLTPRAGTTLLMEHDATLKVIPNGAHAYRAILLRPDANNVTIRGGRILCDRAAHDYETTPATHDAGYGIFALGASNVVIEDLTITGATGDGIMLASPVYVADEPGYDPTTHVTIRRCTIDSSRRNNISICGSESVTVEDCRILNAGAHDGVRDGTAPRWGIDLEFATKEKINHITIRGNTFLGNMNASVGNYNASGVVIEGNFADSGIVLGARANLDTVVRGNVISNRAAVTGEGIAASLGAATTNVIIDGNMILGFATSIQTKGPGALVRGNFCAGFAATGIGCYESPGVTIAGNVVVGDATSTTTAAIRVQGGSGVTVEGNSLTGCYRGVWIDTLPCTDLTVRGNTFRASFRGVHAAVWVAMAVAGNDFQTAGHAAGQDYDVICPVSTSALLLTGNRHLQSRRCYSTNSDGTAITRITRNEIIDANTANVRAIEAAGPAHVVGNYISCKVAAPALLTSAIRITGATGAIVADNTIAATGDRQFIVAVDTSASTASIVTGNTAQRADGLVSAGAGDVINGNLLV